MKSAREAFVFVVAAVAVFFVTTYALGAAGPAGGGPAGGCPVATATSPGCVSLNQIQNPANLSTNVVDAGYLLLSGTQPQAVCTGTGTCAVKSSIAAATASNSVPALSFESANALDADDQLFMIYAQSGGSSVFQIDVEGDSVIGGAFQYGNTNGNLTSASAATMLLTSSATDATTSGVVGAITLKASQNITATDLLLDVQDSSGNHAFTITEAGSTTTAGTASIASAASFNPANLSIVTAGVVCLTGTNCDSGAYVRGESTNSLVLGVLGSGETQLTSAAFSPAAASGNALGTTALPWSDLAGDASMRGSCTLDGASPSVCTATVTAAAICTCSPVGGTAAIAAAGCAVGLSGTTLTVTSANGATNAVNYHCIL